MIRQPSEATHLNIKTTHIGVNPAVGNNAPLFKASTKGHAEVCAEFISFHVSY